MAVADIQSHQVFTLDEQLAMFARAAVSEGPQRDRGLLRQPRLFTPEQIDKMKGKTQSPPGSSKPSSKSPENRVSTLSGPRREGVRFPPGCPLFICFYGKRKIVILITALGFRTV
ncbi:hypothetical protein [Bilophila wadsworthia]|uniref:hypothetical protein n=1 Tax=Bilophila wadsworthia TaxID=35833 RepID=UPI0039908977